MTIRGLPGRWRGEAQHDSELAKVRWEEGRSNAAHRLLAASRARRDCANDLDDELSENDLNDLTDH